MRQHIQLALAMALVGVAGPSLAQKRAELFAQLDTNQDGFVALDEVPAEHQAKFKRLLKLAGKEQDQKLNRALFEGAVKADTSPGEGAKAVGEATAPAAPTDGDFFSRLDSNRDGVVTAEEAGESQQAAFDRLLKNGDIDGDGKLSRDEYSASTKETATQRRPGRGGGPPSAREMLTRFDRDGDGKLSRRELPEPMRNIAGRIDRDGNGVIDEEELHQMMANRQRLAGPGGVAPPGAPAGGLFAVFDVDRDGELSTSEIVGAGTALLKLDKNDDGKLTPEEIFAGGPGRPRP